MSNEEFTTIIENNLDFINAVVRRCMAHVQGGRELTMDAIDAAMEQTLLADQELLEGLTDEAKAARTRIAKAVWAGARP